MGVPASPELCGGLREWCCFPPLPKETGSGQGQLCWHRIGESGSFPVLEGLQRGTDWLPVQVHAAGVPASSPPYYFLLSPVSGANFCRQISFDLPKCHSPIKGKI